MPLEPARNGGDTAVGGTRAAPSQCGLIPAGVLPSPGPGRGMSSGLSAPSCTPVPPLSFQGGVPPSPGPSVSPSLRTLVRALVLGIWGVSLTSFQRPGCPLPLQSHRCRPRPAARGLSRRKLPSGQAWSWDPRPPAPSAAGHPRAQCCALGPRKGAGSRAHGHPGGQRAQAPTCLQATRLLLPEIWAETPRALGKRSPLLPTLHIPVSPTPSLSSAAPGTPGGTHPEGPSPRKDARARRAGKVSGSLEQDRAKAASPPSLSALSLAGARTHLGLRPVDIILGQSLEEFRPGPHVLPPRARSSFLLLPRPLKSGTQSQCASVSWSLFPRALSSSPLL